MFLETIIQNCRNSISKKFSQETQNALSLNPVTPPSSSATVQISLSQQSIASKPARTFRFMVSVLWLMHWGKTGECSLRKKSFSLDYSSKYHYMIFSYAILQTWWFALSIGFIDCRGGHCFILMRFRL